MPNDLGWKPVSGAEERLLQCATGGRNCVVSSLDWRVDLEQLEKDETYHIRAEFLRFLALGGDADHRTHAAGIQVEGGFVSGEVDFRGVQLVPRLALSKCFITDRIVLEDAHGGILYLASSRVGCIAANRAKFSGSVFLNERFKSKDEVSFYGAEIGGSLQCSSSTFSGRGALVCSSARISGNVYLNNDFNAKGAVWFIRAEVGGSLVCTGAKFRRYDEQKSGGTLIATGAQIKGDVMLNGGTAENNRFAASGKISLESAQIGGALTCTGGAFEAPEGIALDLDGAKIAGNVLLNYGFDAKGSVSLRGTAVGGNLECTKGQFAGHDGVALQCTGAAIERGVFLNEDCVFKGLVDLTWIQIGRGLICSGAKFEQRTRVALACYGAKITNDVALDNFINRDRTVQFIARANVAFSDAKIGGSVYCIGGLFQGCIDLSGAEIGGNLNCARSHFTGATAEEEGNATTGAPSGAGRQALLLGSARITGGIFLGDEFRAQGCVFLYGTKIGGNLECTNGRFNNPGGAALDCTTAKIAGGVLLSDGFIADGEICFLSAELSSQLVCTGGFFQNTGKISDDDFGKTAIAGRAINLQNTRIGDVLFLGKGRDTDKPLKVEGSIDLRNARARTFVDDEASWPRASTEHSKLRCCMILDGFSYDRLGVRPLDWRARMRWLESQPDEHLHRGFRSQPFEQLAKALRDIGREDDARRIGTAKQKRLWRQRTRQAFERWGPIGWLAGGPLFFLVGKSFGVVSAYGYSATRVIISLVLLLLVCGYFYGRAWDNGVFVPTDPQLRLEQDGTAKRLCGDGKATCGDMPAFVRFDPLFYSADVILPLSNIQQKATWSPSSHAFVLNLPGDQCVIVPAWTTRAVVGLESALGAVGMVLLGAILSGLLKRD